MSSVIGPSISLARTDAMERPHGQARPAHGWINTLIDREGPALLRMLWRVLGNEQDVLDAYQDCWCSLARLPNPGDVRSAKAFAYRTASNIAIEMIRRKARRRAHWPDVVASRRQDNGNDDAPPPPVPIEALRQAIGRLPPHLRNVVVLRDLGGMRYKGIAETLGIGANTARVYRRQAVLRLAEDLEREASP